MDAHMHTHFCFNGVGREGGTEKEGGCSKLKMEPIQIVSFIKIPVTKVSS